MAQCKYQYKMGISVFQCEREALPDSPKGYCILHEDWEHKDPEKTKEAFYKEIEEGKTDFTECILPEINLSNRTIKEDAWFEGATIKGYACFEEATIEGAVSFDRATIEGSALFTGATIGASALFTGATIGADALFAGVTIGLDAYFDGATIKGFTLFEGATIGAEASFDRATIKGDAVFSHTSIGSLTFRNTTFKNMEAQENACRAAKRTQEETGDHVEADYHFYREMEAKRKQKHWYIKYPEAPLQYIFGYGVKPERIILTWLATVFILALIYWMGDGIEAQYPPLEYIYLSILTASPLETTYLSLFTPATLLDCIYFSIATAATPGYGGYYPKPAIFGQLPIYQILAIAEAIFGTFMWAAFIATVARKYMRA